MIHASLVVFQVSLMRKLYLVEPAGGMCKITHLVTLYLERGGQQESCQTLLASVEISNMDRLVPRDLYKSQYVG